MDDPVDGDHVKETVLNVRILEGEKVEVTVKRIFAASVSCPCSSECGFKMMVGTYGHMGKGKSACEHCGASPGRSGWPSIAELKNTSKRTDVEKSAVSHRSRHLRKNN